MWLDVLIVSDKALFFLVCVLTLTALLTWMERKQSAVMQDRLGANRASILGFRAFGLSHIFADALKMFFKEDYVPPGGDKAAAYGGSCYCAVLCVDDFCRNPVWRFDHDCGASHRIVWCFL